MTKILIIDVGHGGNDSGAVANGIVEKVANLNTALALKEYAESIGIITFIIRTTDVTQSLAYRVNYANDIAKKYPNAEIIFISVHHNAGGGDRGEYIHSIYGNEGKQLSDIIGTEMQTVLGQQKKVYSKTGSDNRDYYYVIKNTIMTAIIVEVCFLDNASDVQIADTVEEQKRNGRVIGQGVAKYFNIAVVPSTPSKPSTSGTLFRVRKSWGDVASQIGAFSSLDNAIELCKKNQGYSVFDAEGKTVYPTSIPKIDVTYQVYTGGRWLPNVVNNSDYAGIYDSGVSAIYTNLSQGSIQYRVSPVNKDYYPWVTDRTDYAGSLGKEIDRLQMKLVNLPNHKVLYRVKLKRGSWLPWVQDTTDFAGIKGSPIDAIQVQVLTK